MNVELRGEGAAIVKGYVNVPGLLSREITRNGRKFKETIEKGAFSEALKRAGKNGRRIPLCVDHNKALPLAKTGESLSLKEDNVGLYAEAEINNADVIKQAQNEEVRGWSFGFIPLEQEFKNDVRKIKRLELTDVSLIVKHNPVYTNTSFELEEIRGEEEDVVMCIDVSGRVLAESYKRRVAIAKLM